METNKKSNVYKYIVIVVITAFITFLLTSVGVYRYVNNSEIYYIKESKNGTAGLEQTLANFKKVLDETYIGDVNEEKLKESAIKGYIAGLNDPYTEYLTKEEMQSFKEDTEGEYVGIGIYTTADTRKKCDSCIKNNRRFTSK